MYQIQSLGETTVVKVDSDVDIASRGAFAEALAIACDHRTKRLIVSLEGCRYFDSNGLNVLLGIRKRCWIPIAVVVPPSTFLDDLFFATGFSKYFYLASTLEEAFGFAAAGEAFMDAPNERAFRGTATRVAR